MAKISIAELQPGMIVAKEVKTSEDELLIPAGEEINEKHIELLQNREIDSIEIEGEKENIRDQFTPEIIAEVEKEVSAPLVAGAAEDPTVKIIVDLCINRALKQRLDANSEAS